MFSSLKSRCVPSTFSWMWTFRWASEDILATVPALLLPNLTRTPLPPPTLRLRLRLELRLRLKFSPTRRASFSPNLPRCGLDWASAVRPSHYVSSGNICGCQGVSMFLELPIPLIQCMNSSGPSLTATVSNQSRLQFIFITYWVFRVLTNVYQDKPRSDFLLPFAPLGLSTVEILGIQLDLEGPRLPFRFVVSPFGELFDPVRLSGEHWLSCRSSRNGWPNLTPPLPLFIYLATVQGWLHRIHALPCCDTVSAYVTVVIFQLLR